MAELIVGAIEAVLMILMGLHLAIFLLYFERKGSALIQDRVGANRASITGLGRKLGLPNLGIINTLIADPIKLFTKEDFVPAGADHFLHGLAPFVALFPVMIAFVVIPFGDTITLRRTHLRPASRADQCRRALSARGYRNRRLRRLARRMGFE